MQGKETPDRKTETDSTVGVDVSKSWLDAHVLPAGENLRVANTPEGIRKLKRWLRRFAVTLIAVEATGKWHRALHRSLHAEGWRVAAIKNKMRTTTVKPWYRRRVVGALARRMAARLAAG